MRGFRSFFGPELCVFLIVGHAYFLESARAQGQPAPTLPSGILDFRLELNQILPAQLTVAEGRYWIRISNGVYLEEVTVQVDDERGQRLAARTTPKHQAKSKFLVDLKPGKHRLHLPGRPRLVSTISVVPRR